MAALTAVKSRVPTLSHILPCQVGGVVTALALLDDDIFILGEYSQQVHDYDAVTFSLKRYVTVHGLGEYTSSMVSCARNRCLYLSDWNNASVHRAELSGSSAVKTWSVAIRPRGLSVNIVHNLVVACFGANKVQEYTTNGSLVREISLQAGMTDPWQAVQLSSGDYAVNQCRSPGVVSVVGVDGQLVRTYGQSKASGDGQIKGPTGLAVTRKDGILVIDQLKNRILSINRSKGCVQELDLSVEGGIRSPRGLCLDESRGRLYVSEFGGCRVLVFDGVRL